jgi:hypothetical protein
MEQIETGVSPPGMLTVVSVVSLWKYTTPPLSTSNAEVGRCPIDVGLVVDDRAQIGRRGAVEFVELGADYSERKRTEQPLRVEQATHLNAGCGRLIDSQTGTLDAIILVLRRPGDVLLHHHIFEDRFGLIGRVA